jgi:hypothetical protein
MCAKLFGHQPDENSNYVKGTNSEWTQRWLLSLFLGTCTLWCFSMWTFCATWNKPTGGTWLLECMIFMPRAFFAHQYLLSLMSTCQILFYGDVLESWGRQNVRRDIVDTDPHASCAPNYLVTKQLQIPLTWRKAESSDPRLLHAHWSWTWAQYLYHSVDFIVGWLALIVPSHWCTWSSGYTGLGKLKLGQFESFVEPSCPREVKYCPFVSCACTGRRMWIICW